MTDEKELSIPERAYNDMLYVLTSDLIKTELAMEICPANERAGQTHKRDITKQSLRRMLDNRDNLTQDVPWLKRSKLVKPDKPTLISN